MYNKKKNINFFIALIVCVVSFLATIDNANADSLLHTKGERLSPNNYAYEHFLGGAPAYCVQWNYNTLDNVMYNSFTDPAITERKKYIAGKIIEDINASDMTDKNKILYIDYALNTLLGLTGSRDFSSDETVTNYINNATNYVDNVEKLCTGNNTSGCFNSDKVTLNYSGNTMNQIGTTSNFISNKITLTGLLSSYGGTGTSYTVKVSSSNSNVSICKYSNGTSCSGTSVTLTNPASDYSFYVKVTNATPSSTINVSVTGSNSATYPYALAYRYTTQYQALMISSEKTVSRTLSRSTTLYIPDTTKYNITATKVDEYGDNLIGASFRIYRADASGKEIEQLVKNTNGSATLSYTETNFTTSDEWFNYQYCLVEISSPIGYIYGSKEKEPLCVAPIKNNTSTCYNAIGENTGDVELCQSHTFDCSSNNGSLDDTLGKCVKSSSELVENGGLIIKETVAPIVTNHYSCEGEYTYNSTTNQCELLTTEEPSEDGACSEDFTLNSETGKCEKKEIALPKNDPTYTCDDGYSHENDADGNPVCSKYSCGDENYTYNPEEKVCRSITEPDICKRISDNKTVDISYCSINSQEYTLVTTASNSINFVKINSKNSVSISKKDITGTNELSGAKMKICSTKPDKSFNCEVAYVTQKGSCSSENEKIGVCTNNDDGTMNIYMQWISDIAPRTWRGLKTGVNYYLVETIAPLGYSVSSYIEFMVNPDGTVTSGSTTIENNTIVVKDDLTKITISKQDVTTSKELPGATLKLCYVAFDVDGNPQTIVDEAGNCTVPTLADGSEAIWVSTDEPKELKGLPASSYYLIETITPDDYDTAEKILFTLNQDGTITDAKGNILKDNKIVMYDKKITSPPTGTSIIIAVVLAVAGLGIGTFYYLRKYKNKR